MRTVVEIISIMFHLLLFIKVCELLDELVTLSNNAVGSACVISLFSKFSVLVGRHVQHREGQRSRG